jgi:putative (di)nucleoside polyphosphate hydrolase
VAVLSCGIVVRPAVGRLLLGHSTGWRFWDIPKGVAEQGEDERTAAVRECFEETGLDLAVIDLIDLGRHAYYSGKALHLFATPVFDVPDASTLVCSSTFVDEKTGAVRPEFDRFRYADRDELPKLCGRNLARVLALLEW